MVRMREMVRWTTAILPLVALGLGVTGCATIRAHQTAETEQFLAAAGFQVKPADTPEKLAHLQTLTPRKVVRYSRDGQPQYVYADPGTCKRSGRGAGGQPTRNLKTYGLREVPTMITSPS
jgi:hypothetical protein